MKAFGKDAEGYNTRFDHLPKLFADAAAMLAKNAVGACCCEATKRCFYIAQTIKCTQKPVAKGTRTIGAFCFPSSLCQTLLVQVTPDDPPQNAML